MASKQILKPILICLAKFLPSKIKKLIKFLLLFYRTTICKKDFYIQAAKWKGLNGDETFRLNYPLTENSVVFDIGGYKGDFAANIYTKFSCNIYIFEPLPEFFNLCTKRFENNPKIHCYNFGLSSITGEASISQEDDGSSLVKPNNDPLLIEIKELSSFLNERSISHIDLLKINIEGGEYELLPHIITSRVIDRVDFIQIQFHNFVPYAEELRDEIRMKISNTHTEQWCFPFIWESWELKKQVNH